MRIDLNYGGQPAPESNRSAGLTSTTQNSATQSSTTQNGRSETNAKVADLGRGEDQAQLSSGQAQVVALTAQASQLPEVRQERVAVLRLALQSGQYQVSAEKIAAAVLTHISAGTSA